MSVVVAADESVDPDTDYLFRTLDGGTTWESLNTNSTQRLLAIVPSTGNDTIYTSFGGFVWRTSNNGMNWEDITPPPSTNDLNDIAN